MCHEVSVHPNPAVSHPLHLHGGGGRERKEEPQALHGWGEVGAQPAGSRAALQPGVPAGSKLPSSPCLE